MQSENICRQDLRITKLIQPMFSLHSYSFKIIFLIQPSMLAVKCLWMWCECRDVTWLWSSCQLCLGAGDTWNQWVTYPINPRESKLRSCMMTVCVISVSRHVFLPACGVQISWLKVWIIILNNSPYREMSKIWFINPAMCVSRYCIVTEVEVSGLVSTSVRPCHIDSRV